MDRTRGAKSAAALFVCAATLLLCGCAAYTVGPESTPSRERVSDTAVMACGQDGARLLTPRVEARPDGLHYVIDNRSEARVGYSVHNAEGVGTGGDAPEGKSEHVGDIPPGEVRFGCEGPPIDGMKVDYATLQVSAGASGYKSVELACEGGMAVSTDGGFLAADARVKGAAWVPSN